MMKWYDFISLEDTKEIFSLIKSKARSYVRFGIIFTLNIFIPILTIILNILRHILLGNIVGEFRGVNSFINFGFQMTGTILLKCFPINLLKNELFYICFPSDSENIL